jgi:hypothetical protein
MANKDRLISVEKTVRELQNEIYWNDSTKAAIRAFLRTVPAVDAVEVVHGRWEQLGEADYRCSRCGFRFTSADHITMFQYCRCGAKMDGDGNG